MTEAVETTPKINRTTVRLPEGLHRKLKVLAANRGVTLQALIEAACDEKYFGGGESEKPRKSPSHFQELAARFEAQDSPLRETVEELMRLELARPAKKKRRAR